MLALLRTRRWIGFTAVVIVAILAFGLLSAWQWSRAEDRRAERAVLAASLSERTSDLASLVADPPGPGEWQRLTLHGSYDTSSQVLVRSRPQSGSNGLWVMTPLITDEDEAVWVIRGWTPAAASATQTPIVPAPESGVVDIEAIAHEFETADGSDNEGLPQGQVAAASMSTLPDLGVPTAPFVARTTSAIDGLEVVPVPEVDEGRNVSYAIQWLIFAVVALAGWFYFLRREAREETKEEQWTSA